MTPKNDLIGKIEHFGVLTKKNKIVRCVDYIRNIAKMIIPYRDKFFRRGDYLMIIFFSKSFSNLRLIVSLSASLTIDNSALTAGKETIT